MSGNWEVAPPPKTVDGLLAVPIDIGQITATIVFDGAAQVASADATISYTVGPTGGNPIFDLRQTVSAAWVDGVSVPPAQVAHHTFGVGAFTDLRVVESVQPAGSVHTLRVQYPLAVPDAQLGGAYLPRLDWAPGPRLTFALGLSDLNRARYLEAWLPANLPFDQYAVTLDLSVVNTLAAHSVITNGTSTVLGTNHWTVSFPARFSSVSTLLEVRASDTVEMATGTALLPVSGKTVTIEAWRPVGSSVVLATEISAIRNLLVENENDYGAYLHDHRYVAFFNGGGMEYEGGTTTSAGALRHETFHSWFARGLKPASQADGWWDEGFTQFHDDGANLAVPLDFTSAPITLCSRDPWQRHTPTTSYASGNALFQGLAAIMGAPTLNARMRALYEARAGKVPLSTQALEEHLVAGSGDPRVVHAFHRFVYGLADPAPAPDLWLRDDTADPGADSWAGTFWDSPDLWIRREDDDGTTHESPEYGQDNWFHARVRNHAGTGSARHFVVTFRALGFAGTEFVYPGDFFPATAVKAEFDLGPGDTRIVRARWPRELVPAAGSHTCVVAAVLSRFDNPVSGRHVWQANNLAQKNITIVDLVPGEFVIIPLVIANWLVGKQLLQVRREGAWPVSLVHHSAQWLERAKLEVRPLADDLARPRPLRRTALLDCGGSASHIRSAGAPLTSADLAAVLRRFPDAWQAALPDCPVPLGADRLSQTVVGLRIDVPEDAQFGRSTRVDLVQRQGRTGQVVGGIAVHVNVVGPRGEDAG